MEYNDQQLVSIKLQQLCRRGALLRLNENQSIFSVNRHLWRSHCCFNPIGSNQWCSLSVCPSLRLAFCCVLVCCAHISQPTLVLYSHIRQHVHLDTHAYPHTDQLWHGYQFSLHLVSLNELCCVSISGAVDVLKCGSYRASLYLRCSVSDQIQHLHPSPERTLQISTHIWA